METADTPTSLSTERDEARLKALRALEPSEVQGISKLLEFMGDTSWRVRKATLAVVQRFVGHADLGPELVAGLASETNAGLRNICAEALLRTGSSSVPELLLAIRTPNNNQRKFVVEILGAIGTAEARTGLLTALEDNDPNVRDAVSESLGRIGGAQIIDALRERLRKTDPDETQRAAYVLDALGRARAKLPFDELELWIGRRSLSRHIYVLLGFCGDARAIPLLRKGLKASALSTREVAAVALDHCLRDWRLDLDESARRKYLEGIPLEELFKLAEQDNEPAAIAALRMIGATGDTRLAGRILRVSATRSFLQIALDIVEAFGVDCLPGLRKLLLTENVETRILILEIFALIGDHSVVDDCLLVAQTSEPRTAEAAIRVLAQLPDLRSVSALLGLLRAGDRDIFDQAGLALAQLGRVYPDEVGTQVRRAIGECGVCEPLLYILGSLRRIDDLDLVRTAMGHRDPGIRVAALSAAAELSDSVREDEFIFALADESPEVRATAARALGVFESPAAISALYMAAKSSDVWVVAAALTSLDRVAQEQVYGLLLSSAARPELPIALAALQALREHSVDGSPEGLYDALCKAIQHEDTEVVREVLKVSERLETAEAAALVEMALLRSDVQVRRAAVTVAEERELCLRLCLIEQAIVHETDERLEQALHGMLEVGHA